MVVTNETYKKYVTDDLNSNRGLSHPVKSSIIYRIKVRQIKPEKLHPNPADEFSMETVGPNWNIISDYEQTIIFNLKHQEDIFEDPLYAVRLDKGGYMLLNGHHRWMAALNLRVKKVPVKIVNIIQDEDIYKAVNKSERDKCVTIDFDEVLFSEKAQNSADRLPFPQNLIFKKNIKKNTSLLVREFQRMGYDVWIYTGSYLSEQYIKGLFMINKCHVDGIVNGLNGKKNAQKLKEIFREKYGAVIHIDNEALTVVNTRTKKFEIVDINATEEEWASAAVTHVQDFDMSTLDD